ncbi:MAG: hypothetical protein AAF211_19190, partial [Myxococcota bacterium]
ENGVAEIEGVPVDLVLRPGHGVVVQVLGDERRLEAIDSSGRLDTDLFDDGRRTLPLGIPVDLLWTDEGPVVVDLRVARRFDVDGTLALEIDLTDGDLVDVLAAAVDGQGLFVGGRGANDGPLVECRSLDNGTVDPFFAELWQETLPLVSVPTSVYALSFGEMGGTALIRGPEIDDVPTEGAVSFDREGVLSQSFGIGGVNPLFRDASRPIALLDVGVPHILVRGEFEDQVSTVRQRFTSILKSVSGTAVAFGIEPGSGTPRVAVEDATAFVVE